MWCGRLSWLPVSFLLHVKYTLSYRMSLRYERLLSWGLYYWGLSSCHATFECLDLSTCNTVLARHQWCSRGQSLKAKASTIKAKASTLKVKTKASTIKAEASTIKAKASAIKAKASTIRAKAKAWTFEVFKHTANMQYVWQFDGIGNELNFDCFCLDIDLDIHENNSCSL